MFVSLTTASLNLVMTGVMTFSSTLGLGDVSSLLPESNVQAAQEIVVTDVIMPVTADPNAKLSFARSRVTTVAAPEPPKPKLVVKPVSVDPESLSSKNFDVEATIKAARSELGKSFATGWNQPGECLVAAKRWILAGGGDWHGAGTPIGNYDGAKEVDYKNAAPGDVIQYLSPKSPASWVDGVHTVLVTKNNGDGTLQIIEANNPGGSGFVSEDKEWTPKPPNGLEFKVFRF